MGPFKHGSNPHSILGFFSNDFIPSFRAFYRRNLKCDSDFGTSSSSSETSSIVSFSPPTPSSPLPLQLELDSSFYKEMDNFSTTFDSHLGQYGSQPSIYDESAMFNSPQALSNDVSATSVDPLGKQMNPQNDAQYPVDAHNVACDENPRALSVHPTKEALQAFQLAPTSTEDSNVNPAASAPLPYVQMDPIYFSVFASDDTQHPELLADAARMESTSNALDLFITSDINTPVMHEVDDYRSYYDKTQVAHPQVQQNEGSFVDKSLTSNTAHSQNILQSGPSSYSQGRQLRSSTRKRMIRPILDEDSEGNDGSKNDKDPDWHPGVSKFCPSKRAAASMRHDLISTSPSRNSTPLSSLSFEEDEPPKRKRKRTSNSHSEADESPKKKPSTTSSSTSAFRCDKCDRTFSRSADRERHRQFFHNLRRLPCPTCAGEFSRQDALRRHIRAGCKGKGRKRRTRRWELEIKLGIEGARDPTAEELEEDYDEED